MPTNETAALPSKQARAALDHATTQIMKLQKTASRNVCASSSLACAPAIP